jgi:hypothetical protein
MCVFPFLANRKTTRVPATHPHQKPLPAHLTRLTFLLTAGTIRTSD